MAEETTTTTMDDGSQDILTEPLLGSNDDDDDDLLLEDGRGTPDTQSTNTLPPHEAAKLVMRGHGKFDPRCVFAGEAWDTGTATIMNEIFNLVKNIVGSGGLGLPAGIAAFANAPSALIPAVMVIVVMGLINAYSFSLLGRVCAVTKSKTYQEAWDKSMGRRYDTSWNHVVGLVVTLKAFLGCWAFSIVIGNTTERLLHTLGMTHVTCMEALLGVTILVLFPLSMAQELNSLAAFSVVGVIGTFVTAFTMALRYFDGSYREGGKYYDDVAPDWKPLFGDKGWVSFFSPRSLILVSILSTGYVAHYNAPKYYFELKDHSTGRFNVVINVSFFVSALTYSVFSCLGFLTFGEHSAGFILDNYSTKDILATVSRVGVIFSLVFAYPLLFLGGRDGMIQLLRLSIDYRLVSILMLTVVTLLAIFVNDLTFVLSFGGATLSSSIIYVFPPLMFRALVLNCTCMQTVVRSIEVKIALTMLVLGVVMGVCGATMSIIQTFG